MTMKCTSKYCTNEFDDESAIGFIYLGRMGYWIFRSSGLSMSNERVLKMDYGLTKYEDLVGKTITLAVRKYRLGNGFVLVDVK